MPAKVVLNVVSGALQGKTFVFDEHDTFIFGRAPDCHAQLPEQDHTASRHHFILEANPPDARLRDLGSLNGTFVNRVKHGGRAKHETPEEAARRPSPEVDLKNGDEIRVGGMTFNVKVEADSEHVTATANPKPVICRNCSKDVSREAGGGRKGDFVCQACQQKAAEDPDALLKVVIAQMGARPAGAPAIPGYELGKLLGQGGMGAVYLARSLKDNRMVAVKVMLSRIAVSDAARRRFQREIEVTAGLRHPNCVELIEHGSAGSAFYFVMEFCPGGSVDQSMDARRAKLPLPEAAAIVLGALEGCSFMHDKGIVHRDLKPQNILLTTKGGGTAKVSDFGLAKSFTDAGFTGMTLTKGAAAGTYPFMAREQVTNFKHVKPVSDVWSMGAMLYYMLTATFPRDFKRGADPIEVILRGDIVPIRSRDSSIPVSVAEVIDRAVANSTTERYQTATEFRDALAAAL